MTETTTKESLFHEYNAQWIRVYKEEQFVRLFRVNQKLNRA